MTYKNHQAGTKDINEKCTERQLLESINQKVDYIIKLLKEEDLRFPYHQAFMDTYQNQKPDQDL